MKLSECGGSRVSGSGTLCGDAIWAMRADVKIGTNSTQQENQTGAESKAALNPK